MKRMTYNETIEYLYTQRPAFERQGGAGYKPGLQTSQDLDTWLGHPHQRYRCIHVAGTNGKGSVSHLLAACLQEAGYKVGLFTSPHFVDFRERIRVNGKMMPKAYVVDFVERFKQWGYAGEPSFFELTSAMAMQYFADKSVDIAVLEVGMGGRLDSTNIITPVLSVITNISLDHTEFLGSTLAEIAHEKAGIIKRGVPVVVGEAQDEVRTVMEETASGVGAPITFAEDNPQVLRARRARENLILDTRCDGEISCALMGDYQRLNANTALTAINALRAQGINITHENVAHGFAHVAEITGLIGRWTQLGTRPTVIADSAHNVAGITEAMRQLGQTDCHAQHIVWGMMADKDIDHILALLPKQACYYFTQAHTPRALKAEVLREKSVAIGLHGETYPSVAEALAAAKDAASPDDVIYVGGSMYVLAELFSTLQS